VLDPCYPNHKTHHRHAPRSSSNLIAPPLRARLLRRGTALGESPIRVAALVRNGSAVRRARAAAAAAAAAGGPAGLAALGGDGLDLLLGAVGEVAGVAVVGHWDVSFGFGNRVGGCVPAERGGREQLVAWGWIAVFLGGLPAFSVWGLRGG